MVKFSRIGRYNAQIKKYVYRSPETGLEIKVVKFTPAYICKKMYKHGINLFKYYSKEYYTKIKKILKKKEQVVVEGCYKRTLNIYFDWVIRQAIEGHIIKLFGGSDYIVKVYAYQQTEVEKKRRRLFYKDVPLEYQIDLQDFYLRSYRVGLFKLNSDGYYENTDYFFKLPPKYKRLLRDQIEKNPDIYATNISI